MGKIVISIFMTLLVYSNIYAQKEKTDSINDVIKVEIIRENVQKFFKNQHKRFSYQLKGLNQEYALYYSPIYSFSGHLDFAVDENRIDLLNIKERDLSPPFTYYKPTHFEKPLNVPQQVIDYSEFLLKRTYNNWCEEKFGYTNLEYGDDFGILLIFSPKNIPDSISALKIKTYSPSDYDTASENKKRMMDLSVKLINYHGMGEGLKERYIEVVLKY
jgi:hypothetical protein